MGGMVTSKPRACNHKCEAQDSQTTQATLSNSSPTHPTTHHLAGTTPMHGHRHTSTGTGKGGHPDAACGGGEPGGGPELKCVARHASHGLTVHYATHGTTRAEGSQPTFAHGGAVEEDTDALEAAKSFFRDYANHLMMEKEN